MTNDTGSSWLHSLRLQGADRVVLKDNAENGDASGCRECVFTGVHFLVGETLFGGGEQDVTSRNVLLTEDGVAKLGGMVGLSPSLSMYSFLHVYLCCCSPWMFCQLFMRVVQMEV